MKTRELFRFFLKEINFNIWFKVLIKFMLHLLIVFSEILFLSTFFLILNQKVDSKIFSFFHNNLEIYLYKIFGNLPLNFFLINSTVCSSSSILGIFPVPIDQTGS